MKTIIKLTFAFMFLTLSTLPLISQEDPPYTCGASTTCPNNEELIECGGYVGCIAYAGVSVQCDDKPKKKCGTSSEQ